VAKGRYEVEAAVDSVVLDVLAVEAALVSEVLLKLVVDVALDGPPAATENTVGLFKGKMLQLFPAYVECVWLVAGLSSLTRPLDCGRMRLQTCGH